MPNDTWRMQCVLSYSRHKCDAQWARLAGPAQALSATVIERQILSIPPAVPFIKLGSSAPSAGLSIRKLLTVADQQYTIAVETGRRFGTIHFTHFAPKAAGAGSMGSGPTACSSCSSGFNGSVCSLHSGKDLSMKAFCLAAASDWVETLASRK